MAEPGCREFKNCGWEPWGTKLPNWAYAPLPQRYPRTVSMGQLRGPCLLVLAGTLCGKKVQGTFASKLANCLQCEFYRKVRDEVGAAFVQSRDFLARIGKS